MPQRLLSFPYQRVGSFAAVGVTGMLVSYLVLFGIVDYLHTNKNLAYFVQAVAAIEWNYFLSLRWTWRDRKSSSPRDSIRRWTQFHASRVLTVLMNFGLYALLVSVNVHYLIANTVCIGLTTLWNYFYSDRVVFQSYPMK